ncbi:MAG: GtrA family protein [Azoarcus sp.]|jgi:putative flippase GtrA|nr:GtrA family protein [Azoarcus sp.]
MTQALQRQSWSWKQRLAEPLRFLAGGGLVTLAAHGVYLLALLFAGPNLAWTISFVFGTAFGYCVHRRYVFRVEALRRHLVTFPAIYLLRFAISLGMLTSLRWLGLSDGWAGFVTAVAMAPVGYVLLRATLRGKLEN